MKNDNQTISILVDTLKGEINRMCVADGIGELDTMAFYAKKNIEKLRDVLYRKLTGQEDDE